MGDCRRYVRHSHGHDSALRNADHERLRSVDTRHLLRRLDGVCNGCGPPIERKLSSKFWTTSACVDAVLRRIVQKLNTRLFDRQDAGPAAGYRIQNALQPTAHPPTDADELGRAACALDPNDQRERMTGGWFNGKIEGYALTMSVRCNVPSKRLIAHRKVLRCGKSRTEKKIENENRTGFKHDQH